MTPQDILDEMKQQVTRPKNARMYAGGLLPAFCEFFLDLETYKTPFASLNDFFKTHPRLTQDGEKSVNTLKVRPFGKDVRAKSIRSQYNKIERFYIADNNRYDYKTQPAHATGQWHDYVKWLNAMVGFTKTQLEWLDAQAKAFMLATLEEQTLTPADLLKRPPAFLDLINGFPWRSKAKGEANGAAFQAMVFAFLRAEMPHLQVETRKLHAGGARSQGVGDIDAWSGRILSVTAEVKHFRFAEKDWGDIAQFVHKATAYGANAWVVAESFGPGAREVIEGAGLFAVDMDDLKRAVRMWDIAKQQAAMDAFDWVIVRKERSSGLTRRYNAFLDAQTDESTNTDEAQPTS